MPKLNWEFILYNLRDAQEELDRVIKLAEAGDMDEIDFRVKMEHAYHHLNFAWNIRHVTSKRAAKCVKEDFNEWSKFPKDIEEYSN
jgi:hypothetical protein